MNYYYLGASLPALTMDAKPSISKDEFLALASEHLSSSDLRALSDLESIWDVDSAHPFVKLWKSKETSLRNALVRIRASAVKKDPASHLREPAVYDCESERAASEAAARTNPIEKEQLLDRHRWAVLDALSGFNTFASESVLAYSVKLTLAERWNAMDPTEGLTRADRVISNKTDAESDQETVSETNDKSE